MARKEKTVESVQYGYKVSVDSTCLDSEYSDEQFGPWSESYTNHLESIAAHDSKYPDVTSIHNIEPGQGALVVWIEYSSGDSFGYADRKYTEIMGLFRDKIGRAHV